MTVFALGSAVIAEYCEVSPWIGAAAGISLFAAGIILSHCFPRRHPDFFQRGHQDRGFANHTHHNGGLSDAAALNLAIEESLKDNPNLGVERGRPWPMNERREREIGEAEECPLSREPIQKGQAILINKKNYDAHFFTLGVLSLNEEKPSNPMNRQPLTDEQIQQICGFYQIDKEDFLSLFSKDSPVSQLAEARQSFDLSRAAPLSEEEQMSAVRRSQDGFSNQKRDSRIQAFKELVLSVNHEESIQVQGLFMAHLSF